MVKARVVHIGVGADGSTYMVSVDFLEFPAPGGTTQVLSFEVKREDYDAWIPPDGVTKNPKNFLEHKYIRPAYDKLKAIHDQFKPLVGAEFDW